MDEVEEKPKDIIKFTTEKLAVEEISQLVISPPCGAVSLFVGELSLSRHLLALPDSRNEPGLSRSVSVVMGFKIINHHCS